jgi:hypothetical protein
MGIKVKVHTTDRIGTVGQARRGADHARGGRPIEIRFPSYDGLGFCSIYVSYTDAIEIQQGLAHVRLSGATYDTTGEKS